MTTFDPNSDPNSYGGLETTTTPGQTIYLGNVPHARITSPGSPSYFGETPQEATLVGKGYVKGDQVKLLPQGQDLADLQLQLYQAGYITDAEYGRMVRGSPDEATTTAFAKLLATANMSGVEWKNALGARLAMAALQPPKTVTRKELPPLTISLTSPDEIKAVVQKTARTLYGGNLPDGDLNAITENYQAAERAQQTQQYYQQYDPNKVTTDGSGNTTIGGYGPGGVTTGPTPVDVMTENLVKTQHPEQYAATQIGTQITHQLDSLRSTGYLS